MKPLALRLYVVVALALCAVAPPPTAAESLTFGVYQSDKATVMHRKFSPIIHHLSDSLTTKLGRPVDVRFRIFKTYEDGKEAIVEGQVDFVRFGPAPYILCKALNPDIQLLAMELKKNKKRFQGMIIVRQDSPYESLQDLRGKRFAFGDENSTIGRFLAQAQLVEAGIYAQDLAGFDYLGRHDTVAKAVQVGDYEAGSVKSGTFKKYNEKGDLRVLKAFDNVTKPWICRAGLAEDIYAALKDGLLALDDPDILEMLRVSGFSEATDDDYQFVREGMTKSEQFAPVPTAGPLAQTLDTRSERLPSDPQ